MFQTVSLQKLENFEYQEGHHFKYQSSGEWKSLKIQI
jgi:hypothetical protein